MSAIPTKERREELRKMGVHDSTNGYVVHQLLDALDAQDALLARHREVLRQSVGRGHETGCPVNCFKPENECKCGLKEAIALLSAPAEAEPEDFQP